MRKNLLKDKIPFSLQREFKTALHVFIGTTSKLEPLLECEELDELCQYTTHEEIIELIEAERNMIEALLPNQTVSIWYSIEYNYSIQQHSVIAFTDL